MAIYKVLGLMSGTSLDGLDLCLIEFQVHGNRTTFKILKSDTMSYSKRWLERLKFSNFSATELAKTDRELGLYFGTCAKDFLESLNVDFIASHGHTMYHNPPESYTVQLGHGGSLALASGYPVICDFRSQDVALGGQGAPLVPIGDRDLFGDFEACLNLGGFANVSLSRDGQRVAWDICPVNFAMNHFAQKEGLDFDENGDLARQGTVHQDLLSELNDLSFYKARPPKSLGAEWVSEIMMPVIDKYELLNKDVLATLVEHCSDQITSVIADKRTLVTGGGARNEFLMDTMSAKVKGQIVIPESQIVDFKEALIFAYLGLLRFLERPNVLSSVTGASKDSCSGAIYLP